MQATTELLAVHGLSLPTLVAAGASSLSGTHELSCTCSNSNRGHGATGRRAKEQRQFYIIEPQFDAKGWKHKNVGRYALELPEEMRGALPPHRFAGTITQLNRRTAALQERLHAIIAKRLMVQLASVAACVPAALNAERLFAGELWDPRPGSAGPASNSSAVASAAIAAASWTPPEPEPEPEPVAAGCEGECNGQVLAIAPAGPSWFSQFVDQYGLHLATGLCFVALLCFVGASIRCVCTAQQLA